MRELLSLNILYAILARMDHPASNESITLPLDHLFIPSGETSQANSDQQDIRLLHQAYA